MAQRIAVVGSGISGLGAAWLLARRHQVTLYERDPRLGGHSNTVEVDDGGKRLAIDTGFIVYNELNYPHLSGLFRTLGVPTQASDMSFAASVGGVEYAGDDLAALFAQRRRLLDPVHWRMLLDITRFNRDAKRALAADALGGLTLGEFLDRHGYGRALRERYLLPMGGAIWSCPTRTMLEFPARSFLRFLDNHRLLDLEDRPQWRTVSGGAREYVRRLLDSARHGPYPLVVHRGAAVTQVRRVGADAAHGVELTVSDGHSAWFDQVVLAGHAPDSLALLGAAATAPERELLGAFRYQRNRAVLHRDPRLMPRTRRAWSSWNYAAHPAGDDGARVAVTYWMNRLQRLPTRSDWFVSLNPVRDPAPEAIAFACDYAHPVFDGAAIRAQQGLARIQGRDRLWFAGAWTGYGFHEDGLRSAVEVATALGVTPPWVQRRAAPAPAAERAAG